MKFSMFRTHTHTTKVLPLKQTLVFDICLSYCPRQSINYIQTLGSFIWNNENDKCSRTISTLLLSWYRWALQNLWTSVTTRDVFDWTRPNGMKPTIVFTYEWMHMLFFPTEGLTCYLHKLYLRHVWFQDIQRRLQIKANV